MKALILLAVPAYFAFLSITTANEYAEKIHGDKYCAKMKDGRMVVMHEGNVLTADATLGNGTIVKTDGTMIDKNGISSMLHEGECIDKNGQIPDRRQKDTKKP